ncbi:hypothetical protein P152DRAFT_442089 [Eremomyces bilateralis CBS 781.70]|uniref:Integral membrane protein n=1 Tax=Eremomyces bilateralis CBS 781.70 TaxID=1392243 RepID=A0A6G1FU36_9PEZI|nr:uncharacterized protein P152DRAFT_442089 [Eremomyces bilateralis CBS 781.70]KAF1809216.1 hypothetical protein P152DRAFT_442089 [Eremomyces bilateralis CBS 781.70]
MGESSTLATEFASIFFGTFIALFFFTTTKAMRQSWSIWKRTRSLLNWYLFMIWVEVIANFIFALVTYLFLRGTIPPSLAYFFGIVLIWTIITQLLLQIVANRVSLIMVNRRKSRMIKWGLFIFVGLVNVSVFCLWIPGNLKVSPTYIHLNHIWERVEKSIFLVIDLGLNLYFLYLVRSNLIAKGLKKYWPLFKFNAAVVLVSTSMDILLLGLQSLPNNYDYIQFAPVAYMAKLHIELTMSELISKIVRNAHRVDMSNSDTDHVSGTPLATRTNGRSVRQQSQYFPGSVGIDTNITCGKMEDDMRSAECKPYHGDGIIKTVMMSRVTNGRDCEDSSSGKTTV